MEEKKTLYIACDFDGTLTAKDSFPNIGEENPYAIDVLKRLKRDGNVIILHTCRTGKYLQEAVDWLRLKGITPDEVNINSHNIEQYGSQGPKMGATYYIDDRSLGIKKTATGGVDWKYIKRNYRKLFC